MSASLLAPPSSSKPLLFGLAGAVILASAWLLRPYNVVSNQALRSGNYLPVRDELSANNLSVAEGEIPKEIDGMFIRNGPNPLHDSDNYHWFEGTGMLHAVRLSNGIASYQNKFVQTDSNKIEIQNPGYFYSIFNLKGFVGLLSLFWQQFRGKLGFTDRYVKHTANTALTFHAGKFLALMEADLPWWVNAQTLATYGTENFGTLNHSFTAHPKLDPKTNELFFFGYQTQEPYVRYSLVDGNGVKREPSIPITIPKPVMMHDFAVTEHFAIFMDLPLVFDKKNIFDPKKGFYEFDKNQPCRFGVHPRYSQDPSKTEWFDFEGEAFYVFHIANAWENESGTEITIITCEYDSTFNLNGIFKSLPVLKAVTLNLTTKKATRKSLGVETINAEFPVVNENFLCYKTRYAYYAAMDSKNVQLNFAGVGKYDVETNQHWNYEFDKGDIGGEFVFVPMVAEKEERLAEDDGWLVGFVFVEKIQNSQLIVINAKDMSLAAKVALPRRVPVGFHGKWLSAAMLNTQKSTIH